MPIAHHYEAHRHSIWSTVRASRSCNRAVVWRRGRVYGRRPSLAANLLFSLALTLILRTRTSAKCFSASKRASRFVTASHRISYGNSRSASVASLSLRLARASLKQKIFMEIWLSRTTIMGILDQVRPQPLSVGLARRVRIQRAIDDANALVFPLEVTPSSHDSSKIV
jgi:hypothetical protein